MPLEKELGALKLREDWNFPTIPAAERDPFYGALHRRSRLVPRYLFRTWGPNSGGNPRLNSVNAITPLAFLDNHTLQGTSSTSTLSSLRLSSGAISQARESRLSSRPGRTRFRSSCLWHSEDMSFCTSASSTPGEYFEAAHASRAMQEVVRMLQVNGRLPSLNEDHVDHCVRRQSMHQHGAVDSNLAPADLDVEAPKADVEDGRRAREHLKASGRVPRAVLKLYIDMVGWEGHNEDVS